MIPYLALGTYKYDLMPSTNATSCCLSGKCSPLASRLPVLGRAVGARRSPRASASSVHDRELCRQPGASRLMAAVNPTLSEGLVRCFANYWRAGAHIRMHARPGSVPHGDVV